MAQASTVAVLGGGLMGSGIAAVFAAAGHRVRVFEPDAATRASVLERTGQALTLLAAEHAHAALSVSADLRETVADVQFVTEAAPERLALKRALFAELVALAPRTAILASNTSVIPIGDIAAHLPTAERIVGTHWWNPPHLVPLVEVVQGAQTSDATVLATMQLIAALGKRPAHVRKDVPGFIANRLQHALWREAIAMLADGVCDAQTLDDCVKNSFGLRLSVLGPLENADLVGLDLTLDIHNTIIPALDRHDQPHALLREHVARGQLGCKSGQGFRSWTPEQTAQLRAALIERLQQLTAPPPRQEDGS